MVGPWFEVFRTACEKVCAAGQHAHSPSVLLFYVSRWCQKTTGEPEPDPKAPINSIQTATTAPATRPDFKPLSSFGETVRSLTLICGMGSTAIRKV